MTTDESSYPKVPDHQTVMWTGIGAGGRPYGAAGPAMLYRDDLRRAYPEKTRQEIEQMVWEAVTAAGEA